MSAECEECEYGAQEKYVPHSHVYWCDKCDNAWPHLHIIPVSQVFESDSCDFEYAGTWDSLLEYKRSHTAQLYGLLDLIVDEGVRVGYAPAYRWDRFEDGHHRITVLHDLGAQWIPVQQSERHGRDSSSYQKAKQRARELGYSDYHYNY